MFFKSCINIYDIIKARNILNPLILIRFGTFQKCTVQTFFTETILNAHTNIVQRENNQIKKHIRKTAIRYVTVFLFFTTNDVHNRRTCH